MFKPLHQFARPAIFKTLLATGLVALSIFYWSCQKEPFNQNPATKTGAEMPTATISIEAAQAYFQTHASTVSSAVDDEAIRFVRMMPDWDHVQLDTALSGRQMLVVPLLDQTFSNLNQGRCGATLLFSQNGPDTITADVLVFIADSMYYEQNSHIINFNNFTGVFLFLDLSQRFKFGVALQNGVPVGPATAVSAVDVNVADDREGGINYEDCVERQMHFWVQCNAKASGECNTWVWITYLDCSGVIPNGNGGWGTYTGNNSSGGGGGSGSLILTPEEINNWGWIEHLIKSGQLNFYAAYALGVPVHIFVLYGGQIPPGLNINQYTKLVQLNEICHFTEAQFNWLSQRASLVPYMTNLLAQHNNAPEWVDALKDVIDARILAVNGISWADMAKLVEIQVGVGLSQEQLIYIIENSNSSLPYKVLDQIYLFFVQYIDCQIITSTISKHVALLMDSNSSYAIANQNSGFPLMGSFSWVNTLRFNVDEALDESPNAAEIALTLSAPPFSTFAALEIHENVPIAFAKTDAFWGGSGLRPINHKPDAFRHAYWLAINTRDVGSTWAYLFSEAHESEVPLELILEKQMDQFNNGVGISKGNQHSNLDDHLMADKVQEAVINGECRYLQPLDFDHYFHGIVPGQTILVPTNQ